MTQQTIERFKAEYKMKLTEASIALYSLAVEELLNYHDKRYNNITSGEIRGWLLNLEEKSLKTTTLYTKLAALKTFYRFCVEDDLISHNPTENIPLPSIDEKPPYYLETSQLTQLREILHRSEERAMMELLYATGIRISELAAIKLADIDWTERLIYIKNGKGKKERIVLFTRTCESHLKAYLEERTDDLPYLFKNRTKTKPVVIRTISLRFEKYRDKLGFHLSAHTLRHTFAAHLAQKGMPFSSIQQLLGHKDPNQTQMYARLYNHAKKEKYDQWT